MKSIFVALLNAALRPYLLFKPRRAVCFEDLATVEKKSILVFSNTALGDTLLSTPLLDTLRASFPKAHITLFVHKNIYPLVASHASVDSFILYYGGFRRFISTVVRLREAKADVVLIAHANGPQDIPMAVFSGAQVVLKTHTKSPHAHLLTHRFEQKKQHTIEDRLDLTRAIGAAVVSARMSLPARYCERQEKEFFEEGSIVVGFQVGASGAYRMWPAESFARLGRRLLELDGSVRLAITGNARERELGEIVVKECGQRAENFCGTLPIERLPFLVREFDLLVTNDTGTLHVAIALGVPTVGLFYGNGSEITGAYQDAHLHDFVRTPQQADTATAKKKRSDEAMRLIGVDEVYEPVSSRLRRLVAPK